MNKKRNTLEKIFNTRWLYVALVALVAGLILASDFSHIDDVVHNEVTEEDVISISEWADSESEYDRVESDSLIIGSGKGLKIFTTEVDLSRADTLGISFTAVNSGEKKAELCIDLYGGENFDDPYDEYSVKIKKGEEEEISHEIAYYRDEHPDRCMLRIFTDDDSDIEIKDLKIDYMTAVKDSNAALSSAVYVMCLLAAVAAEYLALYLIYRIMTVSKTSRLETDRGNMLRNLLLYPVIIVGVTAFLYFLYGNIDISYPLVYEGGDEFGVYYYAKNIAENGLSLVNLNVGGASGADMFDYPYSDKLSFMMVKIISLFTDNPYKNINLFYFGNFYIIALVAAFLSRKLGVSRVNSGVIGMLYAFSPYIQMRYGHMWLIPYFMIPVACYLSINIIKGQIPGEEDKTKRKALFWCGMILSFLCAFTGLYYAYFACALFAAAMAIRIINNGGKEIKKDLYPIGYICSTIAGVAINVLPNLVYWRINGINPASELTKRNNGDAEVYGLKLVQMILPRTGHRLEFFRRITGGYNNHNPLVDENMTAALGIVAAAALVISLFLLFSKMEKYKEISYLNLAAFIIATIGGLGSIISVAVNIPMRCYNRMSLIIMFLSLLLVGMLLDELKDVIKPAAALLISICILLVGLLDQTANLGPNVNQTYQSTKGLLQQVDDEMNDDDMIFMLPYDDWPSSTIFGSYGQFIGYLETDGLHWSYGAMQGREEARWQAHVSKCDPEEMVSKLKYAGYDGIYLDKKLYINGYGLDSANIEIDSITEAVGTKPLVSSDDSKYFWKF